ncbi:MAG: AEC family transporter [Clostridia bacterium]|nr:AEC family transporter [Clostridia bacterium]
MGTVFLATLSPMLVLFCCIVIGFVLRKRSVLPETAGTVLSRLETYVLVPALTINTFRRYCTVSSLQENYRYTLAAVAVLAAAFVIAMLLCRAFAKEGYRQKIYAYALTFANYGFMGNAIVPAILGEEVLYQYMMFTLPLNIGVYTWGIASLIPRGESKEPWWKRLINPPFLAILIGALLGLTGANAYIPEFLSNTLSNCAACMGPVAMILTGFIVGGYRVKTLLGDYKVYIATLLRLVVLPLVFLAALHAVGAPKETLLFTLFAFGTPLGLNTVVFPAAYGGDTNTGASMAMISHTLCIVTIPLLYAVVVSLA